MAAPAGSIALRAKSWSGARSVRPGSRSGAARAASDGRIEAYCRPQGVLSHLDRGTAAGRPGLLTGVGLGTFVDPRIDGCRLNAVSTEEVVHVLESR
jgi:propionate CoA-transferase